LNQKGVTMIAENKEAITHLKCREIQAPIVASIMEGAEYRDFRYTKE
jgi:hypothetical protein